MERMVASLMIGVSFDSLCLSRVGRPTGRLKPEQLCILGVQPLKAAELHCVTGNHAAGGSTAKMTIQNIEADVPPGSAHGDEAAVDVVPKCQAGSLGKGFELPPHILAAPVVLKQPGSVSSGYRRFGHVRRWRSYRGELHPASGRAQTLIGIERRPFAQMGRISERPPNLFRGVTQLANKDERPFISLFPYFGSAGRA